MKRTCSLLCRVALLTLGMLLPTRMLAQPFAKGDRVMAVQPAGFVPNVRDQSLSNILFTQVVGVHGTITNGPVVATAGGYTGNWWEIQWDSGPPLYGNIGWSAEPVLTNAPLAGDVPMPDFSSSHYKGSNPYFPDYAPDSIGGSIGSLGNCTWYAYGRMLELGFNQTLLNSFAIHDAYTWAANARGIAGVTVDATPSVGAIAELDTNASFTLGHVAVVESVNGDGTITVTESSYSTNSSSPWNFLWRHRTAPSTWFSNFIHLAGNSGQTLTSGETLYGYISTPSEVDTNYLTLTAGEPYYLVATQTGGNGFEPDITLYRPDGGYVNETFSSSVATLSGNAPMSGTYYVLVHDWSFGNHTGSYLLSFGGLSGMTGSAGFYGKVSNSTNGVGLAGGIVQAWLRVGVSNILQKMGPTDGSGNYTISSLPAGTYELRAYRSGFLTAVKAGIPAVSGQSTLVNFQLVPLPPNPSVTQVTWTPSTNLTSAPSPKTSEDESGRGGMAGFVGICS